MAKAVKVAKAVKKGISQNLNKVKVKKEPLKKKGKAKVTKREPADAIESTKSPVKAVKAEKTKLKTKTKIKKEAQKIRNFVKAGRVRLGRKITRKNVNPKELNRGVVYLTHIPHGFFENEMKEYFGQFGVVTGVNMPRSKTGKSRGYAFIEFLHPEVATVAADTMNNYLMFNRLIKAKYIPPEEQKPEWFKPPKVTKEERLEKRRTADVKAKNRTLNKDKISEFNKKMTKKIEALRKRIKEKGLSYDFQVGYESKALLTGVKKIDPDVSYEKLGEEKKSSRGRTLKPSVSALTVAATGMVKSASTSALKKVRSLKKKLQTTATNQPKESLRKIKTVTGKIGKKVKRKVTKPDIRRVKLETDV